MLPNLLSSGKTGSKYTRDIADGKGSHAMKSIGKRSQLESQVGTGITVEQSVYQHRTQLEGSEKSLVNVKIDCYGDELESSRSTHEIV
jgi:hypothetical protein